ncbi:MAG: cohesin domain-containing protein, partial [Candidatus Saccharibacteria bacterium]
MAPQRTIYKFLLLAVLLSGFFLLPKAASAANLYLSPSSGSYPVGSNITVSVRVNTQNQDINTAEASMTYSGGVTLSTVSQGKTYYLAAPGSPAKGNGTAYLAGGLPTPGYNGTSGLLGTLTFRARSVGTAVVSIVDGKLLLNDGNGTNALSGRGSARFTITEPLVVPAGGAVTVTSGSHPDQAAWFSNSNVDLFWTRPDNAYGF